MASKAGEELLAQGCLDKAIDAYLHGFEADWRDAYPGVNAVTLMELKEPPDPRRARLLPVVKYCRGAPDCRRPTGLLGLCHPPGAGGPRRCRRGRPYDSAQGLCLHPRELGAGNDGAESQPHSGGTGAARNTAILGD